MTIETIENQEKFVQRDLSWLKFNERVLQEAMDPSVPLLERVKFLAIFSSNLDEFFSVRVSALRQFKIIRKADRKIYNIRPNRILKSIYAEVTNQQNNFGALFNQEILPALKRSGLHLISRTQYDDDHKSQALSLFHNTIEPDLRIEWIHYDAEAPFLENNSIYLIFKTKNHKIGVTEIPVKVHGRFIQLSGDKENQVITMLDDILALGLHQIVEDEIDELVSIKLSRDAETYIEDEFTGDLLEKIQNAIRERGKGLPTRLLYDGSASEEFQREIRKSFSLGKSDMIEGGRYHNFVDFFSFPHPPQSKGLVYQDMPPLDHPTLSKVNSIIENAQHRDEILHFPYQKFDYIPKLLNEAASSTDVSEINVTLYRVSKDSEVAKSLLNALKQAKKVTVFIEAKARFDEENNIAWGNRLKSAGANVIYSYPGIKIHSKIIVLKMIESSSLKDVVYIGTGNFNEKTAKIYCDHGLITSNNKITRELAQVFLVLSRAIIIPKCKHLIISPFNARQRFTELVEFEINEKRQGRQAEMLIKMNSLEDEGMIQKLYSASHSQVPIRLIVRGFCCLIPGRKSLSEHITVTSIVDRFLEHARLYCFHHAGQELVFMGSADWMRRNLDRRIEVCTPVFDKDVKHQIQRILEIQLRDNVKARIVDEYQQNLYVSTQADRRDDHAIRAQFEIYNYVKSLLV